MFVLTPLAAVETLTTVANALMGFPQVLAVPVLALAVWWVYRRTQQSDDPAGSFRVRSATGSVSVSISGAYWIALLIAVAAWLVWPLPMDEPVFGIGLVLLVAASWWQERMEAAG